jgi:HD superfamily phosphohydrolase YqeK
MLTVPLDTAVFELLKRKLDYLEGNHTDVAENTIRLYNELAPREVDKIEA